MFITLKEKTPPLLLVNNISLEMGSETSEITCVTWIRYIETTMVIILLTRIGNGSHTYCMIILQKAYTVAGKFICINFTSYIYGIYITL